MEKQALVPRQKFLIPEAWKSEEIENHKDLIHYLTPEDLIDIDFVAKNLLAKGETIDTISAEDFQFKKLKYFLNNFTETNLKRGLGFGVIRGFPVDKYSDELAGMLFWGMGTCMGLPVSQNSMGHRLGHVFDQGLEYEKMNVRGYQTNHKLNYHTDSSDLVGLMCLRKAQEGGLSSVACAHSIFNTILETHPESLPILFAGFQYDRRGEAAPFQEEISDRRPVFSITNGQLSVAYVRQAIKTARIKTGIAFSQEELDALNHFDAAAANSDNVFSMMLEPGDIQFCNNYLVLHSRTEYKDHSDPSKHRHMLRLWLKLEAIRSLDDRQIEFDKATGWSRREGFLPKGMTMRDGLVVPA
ncbi:MAG: TauD/TfdA family dioxygenase [Chitinophagia bacterium]|jgi:Taurine catabolism dioxygenase TauD, TfdA family